MVLLTFNLFLTVTIISRNLSFLLLKIYNVVKMDLLFTCLIAYTCTYSKQHCVFRAFLLGWMKDRLGIDDQDIQLPTNIKMWSATKKLEWIIKFVESVVDELYVKVSEPQIEDTVLMDVQLDNNINVRLSIPSDKREPKVGQQMYSVLVLSLPSACPDSGDEMNNYSLGFLCSVMDFLVLDQITFQEGFDVQTTKTISEHQKKDNSLDLEEVLKIVKEVQPFSVVPSLSIGSKVKSAYISSPDNKEVADFLSRTIKKVYWKILLP
jgi:hypothetical protein